MPTRDTAWPAGTPCWADYPADDAEAARSFYASVLDWSFTDADPEFGSYFTCRHNGLNAAGMMAKMDPSQPSAWVTYFATDDTAATVDAIKSAGGTIIAGPHPVGTLGHMVVALDPLGVAFGTWEAGDHTGFQIYNEPGSVVWNEGAMPDPKAAQAFYSAVFGFRFDAIEGADDYATFATGEAPLGGLGGHTPGSPSGWMVCFSVASTDDAVATVEAAGGKVHTRPHDTPFGRFAVVEDPWGGAFELMQELPQG
jgi:predicted enzyme related to lactoylglutathione lyase